MVIERELLLEVELDTIYKEMCDADFYNKICNTGKHMNVLYEDQRVCEYELDIPNVGKWVSKRIFLPETYTFITERMRPLEPFSYMVILNLYEKCGKYTKFTYKEEFIVEQSEKEQEDKIIQDITRVIDRNMNVLKEHYGVVKECK